MRPSSLVLTLVFLAIPVAAGADRRAFTHTYEYVTQPAGALELELYNTQALSDFDGGTSAFESQIEVEYGITDHWDVSVYQVFQQARGPGGEVPLHYAATKVRTRYRFAERGALPVDLLGYFEVAKGFGETEWKVEPKLIVARDFGRLNAVVNLIPEVEVERSADGDELELKAEPGWAAGVAYEVSPAWKLGVESWGAVDDPAGEGTVESWLGPAASWAPSEKLWIAVTPAFGLTDTSDAFNLRFILSLGL